MQLMKNKDIAPSVLSNDKPNTSDATKIDHKAKSHSEHARIYVNDSKFSDNRSAER